MALSKSRRKLSRKTSKSRRKISKIRKNLKLLESLLGKSLGKV